MRQNNRNTSSKYFNTRTTHFNKFSATASTKLPTKCEKITLSNTSVGLRGLSIKYDVAHFAVDKQLPNQRQTEVVSRSGVKLSPSPQQKGFKRYQSAQKFRPKEIHIWYVLLWINKNIYSQKQQNLFFFYFYSSFAWLLRSSYTLWASRSLMSALKVINFSGFML